ncbi:tol-pal system protein YbgF [Oryzibacter oryziterrae]|uniref:tol-pal system protein YbgF n=1 Tax=Oryzibacter oryziterrae TaxID=2766474 RepID=UPI001F01D89B|nr:tol-pal system protein YbgF [Oryzibacter oryziterrae]
MAHRHSLQDRISLRMAAASLLLAAGLGFAQPAAAGFFSQDPSPPQDIPNAGMQTAQAMDPASQAVRIGNLEEQMRQLNGRLDEMTHQIQVLENLLKRAQEDNEFRFQQLEGGKPQKRSEAAPIDPVGTNSAPQMDATADATLSGSGFTVDAPMDGGGDLSSASMGAPPQNLGTLPGAMSADAGPSVDNSVSGPLDLSAIARGDQPTVPPADIGGGLPGVSSGGGLAAPVASALPEPVSTGTELAPPPTVGTPAPVANTQVASLDAGSTDPRAAYERAYSFIVAGDYATAEKSFKKFLADFPKDAQAGNANYWLGESYYARSQYRDAASSFLTTYKDYPKSLKAPDSLYKLGLSLEGLGETSAACATFGELTKKFPKAQPTLLSRVDRERSKLACQ